jgi:signal transduction histidine kinase
VEGNQAAVRAGAEEARHQVDLIHEEVRDVSHRRHPTTLEYLGLVPALESLVNETEKLEKPRVHLVIGQLPGRSLRAWRWRSTGSLRRLCTMR